MDQQRWKKVLVKIVSFDGKHKISDKWEEEPYIVLDQPDPNIPVFQIQRETTKGKIRTLHRNLLLPISQLNNYKTHEELEKVKEIPKPRPRPRTRQQSKEKEDIHEVISQRDEESSSDEEMEVVYVPVQRDIQNQMEEEEHHDAGNDEGKERTQEPDTEIPGEQHQQQDAEVIPREGQQQENAEVEIAHEQHQQPDAEVDHVDRDDSIRSEEDRPIPRRSGRERRKPAWMSNQEYVFTQQHSLEWMKKCEFLHDLKKSQEMKKYEDKIVQTMLDILKNN